MRQNVPDVGGITMVKENLDLGEKVGRNFGPTYKIKTFFAFVSLRGTIHVSFLDVLPGCL